MVETCSPAINGAGFVVQEGWGFFRGLSAQTYQIAVEALSDLQSFSVMAVPTSVVFDVGESVSGFVTNWRNASCESSRPMSRTASLKLFAW